MYSKRFWAVFVFLMIPLVTLLYDQGPLHEVYGGRIAAFNIVFYFGLIWSTIEYYDRLFPEKDRPSTFKKYLKQQAHKNNVNN